MKEYSTKSIVYVVIAIIIAILIIKFILWLLPIVAIGILAYYIYRMLNKKDGKKKIKIKVIK